MYPAPACSAVGAATAWAVDRGAGVTAAALAGAGQAARGTVVSTPRVTKGSGAPVRARVACTEAASLATSPAP